MNNKGINLITLVITIIVIIILATITINIGTKAYDNAREARLEEQRNNVINAVSARFADNQRNELVNPLLGYAIQVEDGDTAENLANKYIERFKDEGKLDTDDTQKNANTEDQIKKLILDNFDNMNYTRVLQYNDLIALEIENTDTNALFLVNYYSSDVVGPIL